MMVTLEPHEARASLPYASVIPRMLKPGSLRANR